MVLALAGCTVTMKVVKSTSQTWHGGAAGSGGGKNYLVTLTKPANTVVEITQVWIGERDKGWLPRFQVLPQTSDTADFHVAGKGVSEFTVKFGEVFPGQPGPRDAPRPVGVVPFDNPPNDLPDGFTHGAVIYYQTGKQKGTWIVSEFEVLPPLNYP
ncbi:MAG TPA: hypothetical protein VHS96_10810 [Bacteroidia bacterium]|nr:hypothetical protein [Bacteroidia bacterium]